MDTETPPTETMPDQAVVTERQTDTQPQPETTPEPEPPLRLLWKDCHKKREEEDADNVSFAQILEAHKQWLANPKQGKCADLSKWDMRGRPLTNINLRGATLKGTNLTNSDLTGSDFTEADLSGVNLSGSELRNAKFHNANLEDATLTDVKNLTTQQIGGANIEGIIPADAVKIDGTAYVDECLKNAGKLYLLLHAICAFSIITILGIKDPDIILANGTAKLPVVDVPLPTTLFFLFAPLVILLTHFALHLQLLRGWEAMTYDLPAVFPDGKTVERKVHPLMLNAIVLRYWKQLKDKHPPFHMGQARYIGLTAYYTAPLTILLFWDRYLVSQGRYSIWWHLLLLTLAIWTGRSMRRLYVASVKRINWRILINTTKALLSHLPVFAIPFLLYGLYWIATYSEPFDKWLRQQEPLSEKQISQIITSIRSQTVTDDGGLRQPPKEKTFRLLPIAKFMRSQISADLAFPTPTDWKSLQNGSTAHNQQTAKTQDISLSYRSLRHAKMNEGYVVNANLFRANLQGANLSEANLQETNLQEAHLRKANLSGAHLRKAKLSFADLRDTDLRDTDLREVDLQGAKLQGAKLQGADLREARNLEYAGNLHLARDFDKAHIATKHKPLLEKWKQAAEQRKKLGIDAK